MGKRRILVCGSSGFIGRNIFEKLNKNTGYDISGTYLREKFSQSPNLTKSDLTKKSDVENVIKNTDIVIQAAATTSGAMDIVTKPYYHVTDNVIMNSLIFQKAWENKVSHVVFFSCSVMYPCLNRPVKESDVNLTGGIHDKYFGVGWTKVYLEKLCQFYSRLGKTKFTVIRHSNIYGPHDKFDLEKSHVFGATVTKIITSKDSTVTVWGDGSEARDLLYISDLVRFVELAIIKQKTRFELVNVGLGKAVTVNELVKKIARSANKKITIRYDIKKPTIPTSLTLDCSRAKKLFGWYPKVTLEEGIKKTLKWYKENVKI